MAKRTPTRALGGVLVDEVRQVVAEIERRGVLSAQCRVRLVELIVRFGGFVDRASGARSLGEVTAETARAFVAAPSTTGTPAVATMHVRRSALRLLFRVARDLELAVGDPTLDLALPARSSLRLRPLTDDEVGLCRSFSLHSLTSTRASAAWALAEATATTAELPRIRVRDLDLDGGQVWTAGSTHTEPRWGHLESWGRLQLERRLRALPDRDPERPIVYEGDGSAQSRQASSCLAISNTLVRAGLGGEPDVRPASVVAWVGARLRAEGAPIEEVARRLGRRSLDRTARFIGWNWQTDA